MKVAPGHLAATRLPGLVIFSLFFSTGPSSTSRLYAQSAERAFREVSHELGVSFRHETGASGEKFMVETMGSGVAFFDYDLDGDSDLYFVQSGDVPGMISADRPATGSMNTGELYRNDGGRFFRVTRLAGLTKKGYGMGAAVGDIDNDGDPDLLVTQVGPSHLYINNGDGSFVESAADYGLEDDGWAASAAFSDLDLDGDLDLYITRYLDWSREDQPDCSQLKSGRRLRAYCLPDAFRGVRDSLYENLGASFREVGADAGLAVPNGKGLGVLPFDFDDDGFTDLYVANDTVPNFLFHNRGGLRFEEIGLSSGVAYDHEGNALAGMGIASGDIDRDGDADVFVTNFQGESNTLYRNDGGGFFSDISFASELGRSSLNRLGFGATFGDLNNDGYLDLVIANGHVLDNAPLLYEGTDYAQPNQLFYGNAFGQFDELVSPFDELGVSRGLALADWDFDGDLDLVFTNSNSSATLHENLSTRNSHSVRLELIGRRANRDGLGAVVTIRHSDNRVERRELHSGGSYLSENERVLHLGLEFDAEGILELRWPGNEHRERIQVRGGESLLVVETLGIVRRWLVR